MLRRVTNYEEESPYRPDQPSTKLNVIPTKIIPRETVPKNAASSFGFITLRSNNASGRESAVTLIAKAKRVPIISALSEKGMPMGTLLAFAMSVTALSLPEASLLRKVMKPKLLAAFFGTVSLGIIFVGITFNIVLG